MIDILLATRGRNDCFKVALNNLAEQTIASRLNLIVMDGNEDFTAKEILENNQSRFLSIKYFRDEEMPADKKRRWPAIYNFLAKNGTANYLTYWSDDIYINEHRILARCEEFLDQLETVGAVVIPYLQEDTQQLMMQQVDKDDHTQLLINYGIIKRKVFERIGGFDENYQFYHADCDLSKRIIAEGYLSILYPFINSYVCHRKPDNIYKNPLRYNDADDWRYFLQKFSKKAVDE